MEIQKDGLFFDIYCQPFIGDGWFTKTKFQKIWGFLQLCQINDQIK